MNGRNGEELWVTTWQNVLDRCVEAETVLGAELDRADAILGLQRYTRHSVLNTSHQRPGSVVAGNIVRRLIEQAQQTHSPAGGTVEVDANEVVRLLSLSNVDPADRREPAEDTLAHALCDGKARVGEVWRAIERVAQGEDAQVAALRATAAVLVRSFGASLGASEIRTVRGRPVLEMSIGTEAPYSGEGRMLSLHSREAIRRVAVAVDAMLAWAGIGSRLADALLSEFDCRDTFESRKRVETPGITVVAFYEKLQFHLAENVAMELSRFIGSFAKEALEEAQERARRRSAW